jgi:hypothetical protein
MWFFVYSTPCPRLLELLLKKFNIIFWCLLEEFFKAADILIGRRIKKNSKRIRSWVITSGL